MNRALWRLRYRLTLGDLVKMFLICGVVFSHEALREWEAKLAPMLADELRQRRHGKCGAGRHSWYTDETYLKVRGRWCYLDQGMSRNGDLVDTMLSEHRDMAAARVFFRSGRSAIGIVPDRVTTDGHGSYPLAIRSTLGKQVARRSSAYRNNGLDQDNQGIKGRSRSMRGFKGFTSADRFSGSHDELRNHPRPRVRHHQPVPDNHGPAAHLRRAITAHTILAAG